MKTFLKIGCHLILIAGFIFVSSLQVQAQSADVNVAANVKAAINLTKNLDVNFDDISASSSPVLDPNGSNQDVNTAATSGKLTVDISVSNAQDIQVSWDQTSVTLGDGSSATMTFTPDVSGNTTDDAGTSTDITNGANVQTSGSGDYFIYVGGNLGSLSGQTAGSYSSSNANGSGDLTVTVVYQ
ncbi:MAG: hypothetical protein JXR26_06525 [Balneolaceae bacterium]|nr:hypothetical protein [Balneolaceae bacterium]